ncbi:sensor histidine kinase [Tessaracoccus sp. ZS01]|uniref:sensor histidine kinase n=1 Tax=Tessaracoccus sp. ZS01 TaxID=1906324 RepID=UPI00096CC193|nr:histidine kinase [Tessaracoccus sp. ZS01]MCG6567712.1 ATPase [Tessaracoccus sp. ZS01]OMG55785.1 hypothetical protein BJN44_08815 [Tessaracoccus sp. ZS01]
MNDRAERYRPDCSDLAILTGYAVLALFLAYLSLESPLRTPLAPILLLGAGGIATVLTRRRRPAVAFAATLAALPLTAGWGSGAEAVLVLPALYEVGATRTTRRAWGAFGLAATAGALGALILSFRVRFGPPLLGLAPRVDPQDWPTDWLSATTVFVAAALITVLIGINVGHRRRHIAALVEQAEQMRRERDQQASIARAQERERIAREMHDVIAHSLSVMIALADGAHAAASSRPEESLRAIGRVAETGRRTLGEVRRLLGAVRDDDGSPQATLPSSLSVEHLPALVDEFRAAGLPVRLELQGDPDAGAVVGLTVYRVAQESLTNVLRHAREVRDVLVRVVHDDDAVTVLIEDTSAPVQADTEPGRGLLGIRERAAFYDGRVNAGPRAGGGWRVDVRLPMEER